MRAVLKVAVSGRLRITALEAVLKTGWSPGWGYWNAMELFGGRC